MRRKYHYKKVLLFLSFLVLAAMSGQGCLGFRALRGSGTIGKETREVKDFKAVELMGIGTVYIKHGEKESLRIEADDNLISYFETDVDDGVLTISAEENVILRPRKPVKFYLIVKELEKIEVSGSGDVRAPDLSAEQFFVGIRGSGEVKMEDLTSDSLEVEISGSGGLKLGGLDSKELKVNVSGSGDVDVAGGRVDEQDISISGSGKYKAREMESARAEARVTGSGDIEVRAQEHLKINISGSGNVSYSGNPTVEQSVSGSGKTKRLSD